MDGGVWSGAGPSCGRTGAWVVDFKGWKWGGRQVRESGAWPLARTTLLWPCPSYREATVGTEKAPLYLRGVHRGGRVGEPPF